MFARTLVIVLALAVLLAVVTRSSSGAGRGQIYIVRPTDTLWSIAAAHYGGDPREGVWQLERRNRLVDEVLRPGEKLVLP